MYEFRKYTQLINEAQSQVPEDFGFEADTKAKMVAVNFDNADIDKQMTVVCSGAARGGSSILPFLLQNMGLPMGTFEADNYEDIEMLRSRQSVSAMRDIIAKRNENERWGFKIPSLRRGQFGFLDEELRNPVYVYIIRNPLLTAQSVIHRASNDNFSSDRKGFSNAIQGCVQSYLEFITFMRQTKNPCILLPMENLRNSPRECVSFLNDHLKLGADASKVDELAEQVMVSGYKPRK